MSQTNRNETAKLFLTLLITLGLVGAGGWWLFKQNLFGTPDGARSTQTRQQTQTQLSSGERGLIPSEMSQQKQMGIDAIAGRNYPQAVINFEAALRADRNDPEALIYLNNARIGEQSSYKIAVSAPIGASVNPALEILRGVAQAQTEINQANGVQGIPLKIVIVDDQNDAATAQQAAKTLVNDPDVLAAIGHFSSGVTLAAAPVYDDGKLTLISPTSTSVKISGLSEFVFRTAPSDRFAASALARYMLEELQKQKAAVFFNSESDYSQSLKEEFTTAVFSDGGQVLAEFDLASPTFNAQNAIEQVIKQQVEVLMLAANTPTLDRALQVVVVNRGRMDLLGGDSLYNPKTLQVGGEAAMDMVVAIPWHLLANTESDFVQNSRKLWGGDVSWRTAMAYDAMQALIAALNRNPSRQGVQQAMVEAGFTAEGSTDIVRFLPSGDRKQASQLVTVQPGERSSFGYDFVPVP
ncbi:MAG: ABC transporter substrate-binding protein [Leptolyngbyaceae cyanobacterium MO_188.B28]|nr:ABC transporter substrate-binding protein [Leptolyngbyaceae cyanobacterium MO_188.B28]